MRLFEANFGAIVTRFYVMMVVIIGSFFMGIYPLAFLALPIFLSAMLGVKFDKISVPQFASKKRRKQNAPMMGQLA